MEYTVIDGRYHLHSALGEGGEARVYRGRDAQTDQAVAVRLATRRDEVVPGAAPAETHPGWVHFLASGVDSVFGPYQVYELLEGRTLRQTVETGPLPVDEWQRFVWESLDAVDALHLAGWAHGDLNADNFMATAHGWKLLELPFYRPTPPTGRSAMFGSIHTIAPEQFDGRKPDELSDLYSLGCLYYYAASGVYPHPGGNVQDVAIHCLRFDPEPLEDKAPQLSAAQRDLVLALLARKRDSRPASAMAARQLLGVA
jgi:serine/threonine-protein kinase